MSYLEEFRTQLAKNDLHRVLQLWEEYCSGDNIDAKELTAILKAVKHSDLAEQLGEYIELILPLWRAMEDEELSYKLLSLIIDLQTTNSEPLADTAYAVLEKRYGKQEYFGVKLRLVGLRNRENFAGCISNYDLLSHLDKGKFVFHTGGWGTGEITDYSLVREELTVEFEFVVGKKDLSFGNAFKYLIPLTDDHFLARRFGDPDALEEESKKEPVKIITKLLEDLGPKTAAEIKEEMHELVIPPADWTKWWQMARSKLKKDTHIEMPANIKQPFRLRDTELTHNERFLNTLRLQKTTDSIILTIYNFSRDFSDVLKATQTQSVLKEKLVELTNEEQLSSSQRLQISFLWELLFPKDDKGLHIEECLPQIDGVEETIQAIDIVAFKKRTLVAVRELRTGWKELFLNLFLTLPQAGLKEYLVKQLISGQAQEALEEQLQVLMQNPKEHAEAYAWYFQKALSDPKMPFGDRDGLAALFEGLLILYSQIELSTTQRELSKKIYVVISKDRWKVVRDMLAESDIEYAKEFLLLVTKCQTLSNHDIKILQSLAEVVHPSLGQTKKKEEELQPIWTTEEGFQQLKEKMHHIGTVETVDNAKEIEKARALGDLRENAEYKAALERRSRLQSELKLFSQQAARARVITPDDIHLDQVGIGAVVEIQDPDRGKIEYTILGPWDANPDSNILSFESKLAKAMSELSVGDTFEFLGRVLKVQTIRSYLEQKSLS